jgi:PBP1b-binding outer membrane lipoprotein LpoB
MRIRFAALMAIMVTAAIALLTGCSKGTSNNTSVNTNSTTSASPAATATQPSTNTTAPTTSNSGPSPTEAFTSYYEAIKRKDVEGVKNVFSKGTLSMMEERAKKTNTTVDAVMKEGLEEAGKDVPAELPQIRNEKVDGDRATLEVRNDKEDKWELLHFVREDGQWKIAFDEEK